MHHQVTRRRRCDGRGEEIVFSEAKAGSSCGGKGVRQVAPRWLDESSGSYQGSVSIKHDCKWRLLLALEDHQLSTHAVHRPTLQHEVIPCPPRIAGYRYEQRGSCDATAAQ